MVDELKMSLMHRPCMMCSSVSQGKRANETRQGDGVRHPEDPHDLGGRRAATEGDDRRDDDRCFLKDDRRRGTPFPDDKRHRLRRQVLPEEHHAAQGTILLDAPGQVSLVMTGARPVEMVNGRVTRILLATCEMDIDRGLVRMRMDR